jgi:hypothetical protein
MADSTAMSRHPTLLLGCLIGTLSAQQAPTWTLDEATMAAVLPAIVQGIGGASIGQGQPSHCTQGTLGDYWLRTMAAPRSAGARAM